MTATCTSIGCHTAQAGEEQPKFIMKIVQYHGTALEKFCLSESIAITKNMSTGIIRPAGKRDVMVTVCGLHWNTPDSLVQEYIQKFGGKLMTSGVV